MAVDSSSIQRWLNRTSAGGMARYDRLVLGVQELGGKSNVATWTAAEVEQAMKADLAEFAQILWQTMVDDTDEARKHRRFELTWYNAEGVDLGNQAVRCQYTGEDLERDTSPEGQVSLANAHSIAMAHQYREAQASADAKCDRAMAILERVIDRQEHQLAAMHAREMAVAAAETAAAALGPTASTDAELIEAQTRNDVVAIVKEFASGQGGGKALTNAIERWKPAATDDKPTNGKTQDKPS